MDTDGSVLTWRRGFCGLNDVLNFLYINLTCMTMVKLQQYRWHLRGDMVDAWGEVGGSVELYVVESSLICLHHSVDALAHWIGGMAVLKGKKITLSLIRARAWGFYYIF